MTKNVTPILGDVWYVMSCSCVENIALLFNPNICSPEKITTRVSYFSLLKTFLTQIAWAGFAGV